MSVSSNWKSSGVVGEVLGIKYGYKISMVIFMIKGYYPLVFLGELAVLLGRIDGPYHSVDAFLDLLVFVGREIAILGRLLQDVAPQQDEALLDGLLMLQQSRQQNGAKVLLHFDGFRDGQHVLVVCEVQFAAGLLVLVTHIVQLAATATGC